MAQLGVGLNNCVAQRLHNFGFHIIGKMPPRLCRRHSTPAINDLFFLGLCVMYAREGLDIATKDISKFTRCRLTRFARLVSQKIESALNVQRLTIHFKLKSCDGFVKHPLPSVANNAHIMEEFLQLIRKLVWLHRADAVEHGLIARKFGALSKEPIEHSIIQPV